MEEKLKKVFDNFLKENNVYEAWYERYRLDKLIYGYEVPVEDFFREAIKKGEFCIHSLFYRGIQGTVMTTRTDDEFIEENKKCDILSNSLMSEIDEKWMNNWESIVDPFDEECIDLCKTLNNLEGLKTTESCCGHLKDRFMIFFECNNFSTLAKISRSVNKNYSDGKWELLVDDSDRKPCCGFWLRSKEPFKTDDEMNESVKRLIENLLYWSDPKFNDYFKYNEKDINN